MSQVSKIKENNNLRESIKRSIDLIGGFNNFFSKGDTVLLKPNFNTSDSFPASTDIYFLKEVISLVSELEVESIIIGESSTFLKNSRKEMNKLGVFDLENINNLVKVIVFDEGNWKKKNISGKFLKKASIPEILDKVDKIILLPCLKTHIFTQFTGSLKLSVGFLKPIERINLHLGNIQGKIADLNKIINPDLIIMDARKCFINGGPSIGEIKNPGYILSSTDRVAIDIEGVKIIKEYDGNSLNIDPLDIIQIKIAINNGLGSSYYQLIDKYL